MKLAWSEIARRELRQLRSYSIEQWGQRVAAGYVDDLRDAAKSAAAHPRRARRLDDRFYLVGVRSHYLILAIDHANDTLTVTRVFHVTMDLDRHLP